MSDRLRCITLLAAAITLLIFPATASLAAGEPDCSYDCPATVGAGPSALSGKPLLAQRIGPFKGPTTPLGGDQGKKPDTSADEPGPSKCGAGSGASDECKDQFGPTASAPCDTSGDAALTASSDVFGYWTNERGDKITIEPAIGKKASDYGGINWKGTHWWSGSFKAGKLLFDRYPKPAEMADAPEWARDEAAKQFLKWELELDAKTECGQPVLVGKWYPGSFKWSEKLDAKGGAIVSSRKVTDIGRGKPVDVKYVGHPPAIVDVVVLENQVRKEKILGNYVYPFQPGAFDTGPTLTVRNLFVYGHDLPTTRDGKIVVTSEDPNIKYLVIAVQRDWELTPGLEERVKLGREIAKASHRPEFAPEIDDMSRSGILLRATLRPGVLPGYKSFKLNGSSGSWPLRFDDDVARLSFVREGDSALKFLSAGGKGSRVIELETDKIDEVDPTQFLFKPERFYIEVRTGAPFPLDSIALRVGVDDRKVTWNGRPTITATRVAGSTTIYRTPAVELVLPDGMPQDQAGAYFLPTDGSRIFAALDNPWLFRHHPGEAKLLSGPGDLGHTFKYYLRRAATVDKVDPMPDVSTLDGWRQLSGKTADTLIDVAILSGYYGPKRQLRTWKQQLIDEYLKQRHPLIYFVYHLDDVIQRVNVTVAEHAALLFFRDTFIAQMNPAIGQLQDVLKEYNQDKNSAAMRGLRDHLKAFGWDEDSAWRYVEVTCPGGAVRLPTAGGVAQAAKAGTNCSLPHALSDSYLDKAFPKDKAAADRWSISATAEGVKNLADAAKDARDKAKGLADSDIRGMLKILGRNYEPLLAEIASRLMKQNESGKWVRDIAALDSLKELRTLTDAVVAQGELATADAVAIVKLALAPLVMMAAPALIAEQALAVQATSWGLYAANSVVDVAEAYFKLPDVKFCLGASLALGAEQLRVAETERNDIFIDLGLTLAAGALANGGADIAVPIIVGKVKSAAIIAGRPAIAAIKRGGAAAFKKLKRPVQEAVLAAMLRAKVVQQEGKLAFAGAFERDAVAAADSLTKGLPEPKPAMEVPIKAKGNLAKTEPATPLRFSDTVEEVDGKTVRPVAEGPQAGGPPKVNPPQPDPDKTPTLTQPQAAPAVKHTKGLWEGGPEAKSTITLMEITVANPSTYSLGKRFGVGRYVWTMEVIAKDGRPFAIEVAGKARPAALKLARSHKLTEDFFIPREMVENSEHGYNIITKRTSIRTLKTKFVPRGFQDDAGKLTPQSFMLQEALGPERRILDEVVSKFGKDKLPEQLKKKIAELWVEFSKGGIYAQDMNWGNIYVELKGANDAVWEAYFKNGKDSVEIGLLDFDRIVLWDDYVNQRAGRMGKFLNWVELRKAPFKLDSMEWVHGDKQNSWLWPMLADKTDARVDAYIKESPGPYWPDLEYALEKQLEYHGFLGFDYNNQRLIKGIVEPEIFEEVFKRTGTFTRFNHSTGYNPFPLGPGPAAGRPGSRLGPVPIRHRRIGAAGLHRRPLPLECFRKAA